MVLTGADGNSHGSELAPGCCSYKGLEGTAVDNSSGGSSGAAVVAMLLEKQKDERKH